MNKKKSRNGLKFNTRFKKAHLDERLSMAQNSYDKKYSVTDFKHSSTTDRAFIKALISKYSIPKDASLLDLGCGTGWYSYLFSESELEVTGIDFSRTGILKARNLYGNLATWVIGDGCNLPFKKEFDVIFCSGFSPFTLVDDLSQAKNIGRYLFEYLKEDGLFIFVYSSSLTGERLVNDVFYNHTCDQIRKYFKGLNVGEIIGNVYTTNRQLFPLLGNYALSKLFTEMTSGDLKMHRRNSQIVCGVNKNKMPPYSSNMEGKDD